jgi:hypothetical protein
MKKLFLAGLALLILVSPCFAFFDPVGTIMNLATQESTRNLRETPSPAFAGLVKIYNETCERQVSEDQVKDLWKGVSSSAGTYIEDAGDALRYFEMIMRAKKSEDEIEIDLVKNNDRRYDIILCSAEELKEEAEKGKLLYVHVDEDYMESDREMATEAVYSFIGPFLGMNFREKRSLNRGLYAQMDVAMVITGVKGNKALIWTPKGEQEMDFGYLVSASDFILSFDSPKLRAKEREIQEKNEVDSYMEQLRKEIKQKESDRSGND